MEKADADDYKFRSNDDDDEVDANEYDNDGAK